MSSAETLNFGPQWLRELSGGAGSGSSSTSPPSTQFTHTSKFKLAEYRYGREEMLALFVEDSEIPNELTRAPSLVSEIVQLPLAFRPSSESNQPQLSGGFRGRGGVSTGLRGRSIPGRGRGRGRGNTWGDHEEGMIRKPLLRRAESEDWRSDSLRGKGDGEEDMMGGLKERRAAGQRNDFWKDTWRDRQGDAREQRMFRSRSASAKESEEPSGKFWPDDHAHLKDTTKYSKFSASFEATDKDREKQGNEEEKMSMEKDILSKDSEKNVQEVCNGDHGNPPLEPQDSRLPEKLKKGLEPVSEVNELHDTNHENTNSFEQPVLKETKDPIHQVFEDNKSNLFQNFPTHDSGGGLANTPVSSFLQEVRKTEGQPVSLHETISLPYSSNSPVGTHPALSNTNTSSSSPMARFQPSHASTWFYKDPQGEVQGPFPSSQMLEWFNAGYFTMVLLVARACDSEFVPLGELIKKLGQVPFTNVQPTKNVLPDRVSYSNNTTSSLQQVPDQQKLQQYNVKTSEHIPQSQPSVIGSSRPTQKPQQPDLETVVAKLMSNPDFLRMSPQQRQHLVLQYMEEMKRRSVPVEAQNSTFPITTANEPSRTIGQESLGLLGNHTTVANTLQQQQAEYIYQQKLLQEKARKEEEEIRKIKKQQEEQKEMLKRQEKEYRRRKDELRKEQEEMERLQLETQRKKEEIQRKLEEEEQLKKMKEMELRRKIEEEERLRAIQEREAEHRRIIEAEESRRKQEAEERRRLEQEELLRKMEQQRLEEIRRLELETEERRMQEERRKQEEREKQMAKEAEMQRRIEAVKMQRLKEEAEAKQLKIKQQELQMQQIQLPSSARWGQHQQLAMQQNKNDAFSLKEIQKMEKEFEQTRILEEARMAREMRHVPPPKVKSGWTTAMSDSPGGMSLLDIQREEAKQMSLVKQPVKQEKAPTLGFNTLWNKPPKIQPDTVKPQAKQQSSFWDQVVEENPPKPAPGLQNKQNQQPKKTKATKKSKGDEGQQVKAIFQQQITKDSFTEWCESYLEKMNAGSIDIPTFVNFLRDVDSPFEVREYVQSYLGESREVKDFANLFLEQRSNFTGAKYNSKPSKETNKSHSSGSRDRDGFEMVTGNAKRGKKKTKKSQKVDPSILGFSVNAASNRVNMGEIETAKD